MEDLPIQKVTISGPTLSSLINRASSSAGPTDGLLFGKLSLHAPTLFTDDDVPSPSTSPSSLIAAITGFTYTSPSSPYRQTTSLPHHRHVILGFFSARRKSPLRPSLREHSLSLSFTSTSSPPGGPPCLFLLLTTPFPEPPQTLIHTHEYRVYQFRRGTCSFETVSLEVVNIGPGFRGQYGNFSPRSELPWLNCEVKLGSPMREDKKESLIEMKKVGKDQKELEAYVAEGYDIGSLSRLMGSDAVGYMGGVEELYEKMLSRLDCLARVVESSSAQVLELENHNMKLRRRVAGIE